ncbi:MAG: orotidine-5'-phosphate decarboxylase [Deltaproteobacteria bacterium]|nr:orotidine-5'-phosphate decarboxylase [Deltaproteobacteria bacterium]
MKGSDRICAALDVPDPQSARALAQKLSGRVGMLKVGLELFVAHGRAAVDAVRELAPIFLDLKLHDIPQTVESAARGAGALGASLVTIHASGGAAMVAAAKKGLAAGAQSVGLSAPKLLAVTVLTSLDDADLTAIGLGGPSREAVLRLGRLAVSAGADGLVCSPHEVSALRAALGHEPWLVVPGVRPAGSAAGDQRRTGTPASTVRDGADLLVIGRPLRDAADPGAAAETIAAEIDAG